MDVSYNHLMYCDIKSCCCQKKEHDQKLQDILTRVAGTSIDHVKNPKTYTNNTTGYRGVYLIRGKWIGKIIFQQKAYYLGTYKNINEAVEARREAEEILFGGTAEYYAKWKLTAEQSPEWAEENPVQISVGRDYAGRLTLSFVPALEVVERMQMAPASLGGGC